MSLPAELDLLVPTREFGPITTEMLVRYSGASGDFNPMHYDKDFAVGAGYPGVFSQGMHHAGLLATYVTELPGVASVRRFAVRFHDQVWLGDVLRCAGEAKTADGELVTLSLTMTTVDDRHVLSGEADVLWAGAR